MNTIQLLDLISDINGKVFELILQFALAKGAAAEKTKEIEEALGEKMEPPCSFIGDLEENKEKVGVALCTLLKTIVNTFALNTPFVITVPQVFETVYSLLPAEYSFHLLLNSKPYLAEEFDEDAYNASQGMIKFGGSFVSALGDAVAHADGQNKRIIKLVFSDIWEKHANLWRKFEKAENT